MRWKKRSARSNIESPAGPPEAEAGTSIEKILLESESGYLDLVEQSNNLIFSATMGGLLYYANQKLLDTLGYTAGEAKDMPVDNIILAPDTKYFEECTTRVVERGGIENCNFNLVTKDGMKVPVEGSISCHFEEGQPVAIRGFLKQLSQKPVRDRLSGVPLEKIFLEFHDRECSIAEPCLEDD